MRRLLLLALLAFVMPLKSQNLVRVVPIDTTFTFTINFVANGLARYNVANYKVLYTTPDSAGNPSTASGMLSIPLKNCTDFSMVNYNHGTVLRRNDVPSRNNFESIIGKVFASRGYVTTMPDYLGLGDSPGTHPYVHAHTQATATVDMMRAARQALADSIPGYNLNGEVFLTGYSQGGHAAMATAKYIQDNNLDTEFNVVGAAPASGPYNLSGSQSEVFVQDLPYSNPGYVVYLLLGMNAAYNGTLFNNPSEILKAPYDTLIPPYFDGNFPMDSVNPKLPARVSGYMEDSVLQAFVADTVAQNHWLWQVLNDQNNYNWRPDTKMRLFYCTNDEQVSFENSLDAEAAMNALGAVDVQSRNGGPLNHGGCVAPSIAGAVAFFDSLSSGCSSFVSLSEQNPISMSFFPNPAHREIVIELKGASKGRLKITDMNGRLQILKEVGHAESVQINQLSSGIYFIEIESEGHLYRDKLVIRTN